MLAFACAIASGCSRYVEYVPPMDPAATRLGAHVLLAQEEGSGVSPAVSPSIDTQANGSSLLVFNAGHASNDAPPTDSYRNEWAALGPPVVYEGYKGRFDVKAWLALHARGGAAHRVVFDKPGDAEGEITVPFIEIRNAGVLQDVAQTYAPAGTRQASGRVTTTGPATLVALWWGDGAFLRQSARPQDGFAVIANFVRLPPHSAVQCVVAVKQVEAAGSYDVHWNVSPAQGAPLWLLAFQRAPEGAVAATR